MERYIMFKIIRYYPSGGIRDFFGTSDSLRDSVTTCMNDYLEDEDWYSIDEYQVYDTQNSTFCSLDFTPMRDSDCLLREAMFETILSNINWKTTGFRTFGE
jgi:hypothetical protein